MPELGIWNLLIWGVLALVGYVVFMAQQPLRAYFGESWALLREKGHMRLWLLVFAASLGATFLDWWSSVREVGGFGSVALGSFRVPAMETGALETLEGVFKSLASLFSIIVAGTEAGLGKSVKFEFVEVTGGLLVVAVGFLIQFFLMLFLYLRTMFPGRRLKVRNLVDLAVRRIGTLWPSMLVCWFFWVLPVACNFTGALWLWWSLVFSVAIIVFAYLEVSVLAKNQPLASAIASNFRSWGSRPWKTIWFLVVAGVHGLLLFLLASLIEASVTGGTWIALLLLVTFAAIRAFILLWLLGSWIILYTD